MKVNVVLGILQRWVIVQDEDPALAWTGSSWAPHERGLGVVIQISNYGSMAQAVLHADQAGFEVEHIGGDAQ